MHLDSVLAHAARILRTRRSTVAMVTRNIASDDPSRNAGLQWMYFGTHVHYLDSKSGPLGGGHAHAALCTPASLFWLHYVRIRERKDMRRDRRGVGVLILDANFRAHSSSGCLRIQPGRCAAPFEVAACVVQVLIHSNHAFRVLRHHVRAEQAHEQLHLQVACVSEVQLHRVVEHLLLFVGHSELRIASTTLATWS